MSVLNIAIKEFEISIRTKRFYVILGIFLVIAVVFISQLNSIMNTLGFEFKTPFQQLFLTSFSTAYVYGVTLLSLLLASTAINSEIKQGTIKVLGAKPIYRDTIIFGKLLGGAITIAVTVGLFYVFMIGIALVFGAGVTGYDISRLLAIYPITILYGVALYALGILLSVIMRNPTNSLLAGIFVFIIFVFVIPIVASIVAFATAGTPPSLIVEYENNTPVFTQNREFQEWINRYYSTYSKIIILSLPTDFGEVCGFIYGSKAEEDILGSLTFLGGSEESVSIVEDRSIIEGIILGLPDLIPIIVTLFISLFLSYLKFIKLDLR
ncbi:ABC transporter permease [Pyrococcus sp.]|uniref:ABC transporter permease n=1 Tax=Pyrococcus sp. TaxID=33866 RepID=UPI002585A998|nr:ABC transporter permease [Pyrococcus sp.]